VKTLLRTETIAEFAAKPGHLRWPWVAFSPARTAIAYPVDARTVGVRTSMRPSEECRVELADGFALPHERESAGGTTSRQVGLHALAVHDDGRSVVAFAWRDGAAHACVVIRDRTPRVVELGGALAGLGPMAAVVSLHGDAIWLSAEIDDRSMICRLAWPSLDVVGHETFAPPPLPAHHELFAHPSRDEVLLLMACGQDGTFAQVARFEDDRVARVSNQRERGGDPSGCCEWDAAAARVFLAGDGGLEVLAWPSLTRSAQRDAPDGLVFNYAGIRLGDRIVLSATDEESGDDVRALIYDANSLDLLDDAPAPKGMWAGRFGNDCLVTIEASKSAGKPVRVHRLSWLTQ
jgi:hypothetical protein